MEHSKYTERPKLTKRQQQVLDFIQECIEERGYPPTMREIGEAMGIRSTNGVNDHLKALERKGYLTRQNLKSRAIQPAKGTGTTISVPLVGAVAAGEPLLAVENVEEQLRIDRSLLGAGADFALRIKGESMIEDGIFDGDYVFVRKQPTARRGETVVAMLEDEATVKRYYPEDGRVRLQPANAQMEPIIVEATDARALELLGVVVGIYRRL
ncbi:MAG: transcriptional repressor LexA [Deltaproteobacteria bacterium]|nr:transcriptional repressor LexA [Deltaproteobacteria bacterium]